MNIVRFQGETPSVYYEFDKDSAVLGEGGMGCVYQGYRIDTVYNLQSIAAIKCIRPEFMGNQAIIQRAQREASVQLDDPNLIRMYGFFGGAEINPYTGNYDQAYYIAMERLLGVNLDQVLFHGVVKDCTGQTVDLAAELSQAYSNDRQRCVVAIMSEVIRGIASLHRFGYIHRDIDPSNVMITQDGRVKVIDFGISKRIDNVTLGSELTKSGQFIGKVAFAAPELILGDIKNQGPRTDIYALGIMMYQLLTGSLPVQGTNQEVADAHLSGKMNYSAVENKYLRKIIEKATSKSSSARYASADEMLADLSTVRFKDTSGSSRDKEKEKKTHPGDKKPVSADSAGLPLWGKILTPVAGMLAGALFGYLIWWL